MEVAGAQNWLRENLNNMHVESYMDNHLSYFLNKSHTFHDVTADRLRDCFSNTLNMKPASLPRVPPCLLSLDKQLRTVLVDDQGLPLLGTEDAGEFVLGFAQV